MRYHPADVVEVFRKTEKSTIEHLWYRLNFFQVKGIRERKGGKGEYDLQWEGMHPKLQPGATQKALLQKSLERQRKTAALLSETHEVRLYSAKIADKLVIGLGGAHVRETALTLHTVYGVPYIPGPSLKGLMRHWVIQAFFHGEEPKQQTPGIDQKKYHLFLDLFGSQEKQGLLQCYEGWIRDYVIEPDVLTPHFPKYYRGGEEPARDNQSPVPVGFYVLTSGELVCMMTIPRGHAPSSDYSEEELLDFAYYALHGALTELGIGAKTSSGYGIFENVRDVTEPLDEVLKELKEQRLKRIREEEVKREEATLAKMSPAEQLVYKIEHLGDSDTEREMSKSLFAQVIEMAQAGELAPAWALKAYWERVGEWKVKPKKKKQYERVTELKGYLEK